MKRRQSDKLTRDKDNRRKRLDRQNPIKRARFILEDCRKSDNKKKRKNDLTKEFIEKIISNGCFYCGDKNTKICLDRIDNSQGHLINNVNASCCRCNFIRNCMPYEAWIYIVPSVKDAFEKGLFDSWENSFW